MSAWTGALLGLLAGTGLLLVLQRLVTWRAPRLIDRVTPYLRTSPVTLGSRSPAAYSPFPTLEAVIAPVIGDMARVLDRWIGGRGSLVRRLERAGWSPSVEAFRVRQVIWSAAGASTTGAFIVLLTVGGSRPAFVPGGVLMVLGAVGGAIGLEQHLDRQAKARQERMLAELPTLAELLALSVAAGEGVAAAIERAARAGRGVLAQELLRVSHDMRSGTPLADALRALGRRSSQPAVGRFVDGVVIAVERGTPMADVLRAQAIDVREARRRELMEIAGRREIAMMVPVVFLVLPVTVVFALFPGFFGLSLTV